MVETAPVTVTATAVTPVMAMAMVLAGPTVTDRILAKAVTRWLAEEQNT